MIKTCQPRLESTYQCKSSRGVISVFVVVVVYLGYLSRSFLPPAPSPPPPTQKKTKPKTKKKTKTGSPSNLLLPLQYNVSNYIEKKKSFRSNEVSADEVSIPCLSTLNDKEHDHDDDN